MDEPRSIGEERFGSITLTHYELTTAFLCPRSIAIFGGTTSGKTTFTSYLLSIMNDDKTINSGILINPTGNTDYTSLFPQPCIHKNFDKPIIQEIWDVQKKRAEIYRECTNPENLQAAYDRYCSDPRLQQRIRDLELTVSSAIRTMRHNGSGDEQKTNQAIKEIEDSSKMLRIRLLKSALSEFYRRNPTAVQSQEDALVLANVNLNPNLLIVFDDCASIVGKLWRWQLFEELYYNARHFFISTIMLLQATTGMNKAFRDNVHIIFFTCPKQMLAYFTLGGSRAEKQMAEAIASSKFFDRAGGVYRVVMYSRGKFGFVISQKVRCGPIGSPEFQEYGRMLAGQMGSKLSRLAKEVFVD